MHTDYNEKFNKILMDLAKNMYEVYGTSDMTKSFEVTVQFDANQRIASMNNMKVDGQLKTPSKEFITLVEKLNTIAEQLLTLPEMYRLKECYFSVQDGGKINIQPVYLNNECTHIWLGNGLWDGKTPEGNRTGGILFTCKKCNASATSEEDIKKKGGTIDWENSKLKPSGYKP